MYYNNKKNKKQKQKKKGWIEEEYLSTETLRSWPSTCVGRTHTYYLLYTKR